MPYSAAQLTSYYTTLTVGATPGAADMSAIATAAAQDAAGTITDAQAFAAVNYMSAQVRGTTDVAVETYAFFTGSTPSQAGINYLVNNPGTGYNTGYYNAGGTPGAPGAGGFDIENRYFNAAINLAGAPGAPGYAAFSASYGGLTLAQAIASEYAAIIGPAVSSTATQSAVASITAALPYFQALAARFTAAGGSVDIATKALIAGYILEEGVKADVGVYAQALDGFNAAFAMGAGVFNTNLLATFGAGGTAFNAGLQPLAAGQTLTSSAASLTSLGVVAGGQATLNVASGATLTFTGDIAVNTGQVTVNEAAGSGLLNLAFTGQTTSTAPSVIATGVTALNVSATANAAGAVLSLDFENPGLASVTIRGNESVAYSAPLYAFADGSFSFGALTSINASQATAPVNIDVSSMPGTANMTASGGVTVVGTSGADTFSVRNYATVTGGGGNDTIVLYQPASISAISAVTDDHAGVVVGFAGLKAATFNATAISATSVQNGLDQAAAKGPGTVSYFQSGGDTYLVADNSTATTFQFGNDFAIRLIGAHALAGSTLNGFGQVVLGG